MKAFDYHRPRTIEDAVAAKSEGGSETAYLGGGTNLVDLMRLDVARPSTLVDVTSIVPGRIELDSSGEGKVSIGAGVRNSVLAADPRVRTDYPVLSQALLSGASGQLRNMATVGGNLLQRTRCVYFQDATKACNKRAPGSGCPAKDGIHRDLAILGTSEHCIASHPSDMAVALVALDAVVRVTGVDGTREFLVADLYRSPGDDPSRDTTLEDAELIVGIDLPAATALSRRSAYRKARDRASFAFATGAVALALDLGADGVVADVRIVLGAVAPHPWRARVAEDRLRGTVPDAPAVAAAIDEEMRAADLRPDNAFKAELAASLAAETWTRLVSAASPDRGERS